MGVRLRVLLVEDSKADAELILLELRRGGYDADYERVDTPERMKAALEKRPFDIILTDYVMPRFSGLAALRLVRDRDDSLPVIVVTGQVGEDTAVETMKAGANDYILKGNLTRLVPAIRRELREVEVRRERRQAEEDRDRLVAQLRDVNARLAVNILAAKEAAEREQAMRLELSQAHAGLEKLVEERTRELAGERERLAITLRSIGDGMIATDTQGNVTLLNDVAEDLTGWPAEVAIGRTLAEVFNIINEESRAALDSPVVQVLRTGEIVGLANNTVLVAKDGTERMIADSAAPIRGQDGDTTGVVLVFRDVTDRKQAEDVRDRLLREVETQRTFLQTVIDNAPAGIALLRGPNFVFELANPAYQAMVPGKELVGRTVAESWPELASQIVPLLEHVFRSGEPYRTVDAPYPVQRTPAAPLEEVYFTFSYIPLFDPSGQVEAILVLVIETTEQVQARKRTEDMAREAQRRSEQLQSDIDKMRD